MYRPVNIQMRPILTNQMITDITDRNKLVDTLRNVTYFGTAEASDSINNSLK